MRDSILRVLAIATLALLLHACSTLQGQTKDGIYTAPDAEFTVMVPPIIGVASTDGKLGPHKEFVDFVTGSGYWMAQGGYSLEWYKLDHAYDNDAKFYADTSKILPSLVKAEEGTTFSIIHTSTFTVNGHAAYQAIARGIKDKLDAYWVGTSINFGNRIALAMLVVPAENSHQPGPGVNNAIQAATWGYYPKFIDSIQDRVPYP